MMDDNNELQDVREKKWKGSLADFIKEKHKKKSVDKTNENEDNSVFVSTNRKNQVEQRTSNINRKEHLQKNKSSNLETRNNDEYNSKNFHNAVEIIRYRKARANELRLQIAQQKLSHTNMSTSDSEYEGKTNYKTKIVGMDVKQEGKIGCENTERVVSSCMDNTKIDSHVEQRNKAIDGSQNDTSSEKQTHEYHFVSVSEQHHSSDDETEVIRKEMKTLGHIGSEITEKVISSSMENIKKIAEVQKDRKMPSYSENGNTNIDSASSLYANTVNNNSVESLSDQCSSDDNEKKTIKKDITRLEQLGSELKENGVLSSEEKLMKFSFKKQEDKKLSHDHVDTYDFDNDIDTPQISMLYHARNSPSNQGTSSDDENGMMIRKEIKSLEKYGCKITEVVVSSSIENIQNLAKVQEEDQNQSLNSKEINNYQLDAVPLSTNDNVNSDYDEQNSKDSDKTDTELNRDRLPNSMKNNESLLEVTQEIGNTEDQNCTPLNQTHTVNLCKVNMNENIQVRVDRQHDRQNTTIQDNLDELRTVNDIENFDPRKIEKNEANSLEHSDSSYDNTDVVKVGEISTHTTEVLRQGDSDGSHDSKVLGQGDSDGSHDSKVLGQGDSHDSKDSDLSKDITILGKIGSEITENVKSIVKTEELSYESSDRNKNDDTDGNKCAVISNNNHKVKNLEQPNTSLKEENTFGFNKSLVNNTDNIKIGNKYKNIHRGKQNILSYNVHSEGIAILTDNVQKRETSTSNVQRGEKEISTNNAQRGEKEISTDNVQRGENEISTDNVQRGENEISTDNVQRGEKEISTDNVQRGENEISTDNVQRGEKEISTSNVQRDEKEISTDNVQRGEKEISTDNVQRGENEISTDNVQRGDKEIWTDNVQRGENEISTDNVQRGENEISTDNVQRGEKSTGNVRSGEKEISTSNVQRDEKEISTDNVQRDENEISTDNVQRDENVISTDNVQRGKNEISTDNVKIDENGISTDNVQRGENEISTDNVKIDENGISTDNVQRGENEISTDNVKIDENGISTDNVQRGKNEISTYNVKIDENGISTDNATSKEDDADALVGEDTQCNSYQITSKTDANERARKHDTPKDSALQRRRFLKYSSLSSQDTVSVFSQKTESDIYQSDTAENIESSRHFLEAIDDWKRSEELQKKVKKYRTPQDDRRLYIWQKSNGGRNASFYHKRTSVSARMRKRKKKHSVTRDADTCRDANISSKQNSLQRQLTLADVAKTRQRHSALNTDKMMNHTSSSSGSDDPQSYSSVPRDVLQTSIGSDADDEALSAAADTEALGKTGITENIVSNSSQNNNSLNKQDHTETSWEADMMTNLPEKISNESEEVCYSKQAVLDKKSEGSKTDQGNDSNGTRKTLEEKYCDGPKHPVKTLPIALSIMQDNREKDTVDPEWEKNINISKEIIEMECSDKTSKPTSLQCNENITKEDHALDNDVDVSQLLEQRQMTEQFVYDNHEYSTCHGAIDDSLNLSNTENMHAIVTIDSHKENHTGECNDNDENSLPRIISGNDVSLQRDTHTDRMKFKKTDTKLETQVLNNTKNGKNLEKKDHEKREDLNNTCRTLGSHILAALGVDHKNTESSMPTIRKKKNDNVINKTNSSGKKELLKTYKKDILSTIRIRRETSTTSKSSRERSFTEDTNDILTKLNSIDQQLMKLQQYEEYENQNMIGHITTVPSLLQLAGKAVSSGNDSKTKHDCEILAKDETMNENNIEIIVRNQSPTKTKIDHDSNDFEVRIKIPNGICNNGNAQNILASDRNSDIEIDNIDDTVTARRSIEITAGDNNVKILFDRNKQVFVNRAESRFGNSRERSFTRLRHKSLIAEKEDPDVMFFIKHAEEEYHSRVDKIMEELCQIKSNDTFLQQKVKQPNNRLWKSMDSRKHLYGNGKSFLYSPSDHSFSSFNKIPSYSHEVKRFLGYDVSRKRDAAHVRNLAVSLKSKKEKAYCELKKNLKFF